MALRFDGRVAIVTGAGGGLGRTYALELAKRGCKVVVNDLGGDAHGTSASTSMADKVVGEIKAAGGQAVANYDSVEFGEKIVKTAIDAFGRVDIVINNAGILRDVSLVKMTDLDWDLIFKVHVKGAYSVTKAAWPYMRKQNYGRIIVTSSNAGIYGNFGQTNYAAAKSALVGFSNSLAQEGAKYNIVANALIPTAGSRLTQTVLPESLLNALKPEYVTPLAVYLCHESFTESGKVFEAGAGWYGTLKYYRSVGKVIPNATAENLRDNWSKITDMKDAQHFESMRDMMSELMGTMADAQESGAENHSAPSSRSGDFPSHIKCSALFKEMNEGVQQDPSAVKKINAIILYILTDGTKEIGKFTLDFKSASPSVYYGDVKNGEKPTATVTVSDDDFLDIASGKLNPQKAFMGGKLKVKGNVMLLQKLQTVLDKKRKAKL
ncbi:D-family protein [Ancylostoma duodenale]|uniref:Peroxisomal multifunctional enzyme type 2 n=1 Tax=Ancylostoma duodenale TaxID=51022 RepID=A0A0C2CG60_9BILA|nr:D-family protein [Ancylostoma duodenale]